MRASPPPFDAIQRPPALASLCKLDALAVARFDRIMGLGCQFSRLEVWADFGRSRQALVCGTSKFPAGAPRHPRCASVQTRGDQPGRPLIDSRERGRSHAEGRKSQDCC